MSMDHALGPDGFDDLFIKKCWHTIKDDFSRLFSHFAYGKLNIEHINISFITLIPKKDCPRTVNDYMLISWLNTSLKLLTKFIANKLRMVIQIVVHQNQYDFIKGRTNQDCLTWAFQFLHICHKSKREVVILKLDFENPFNMVEHEVILQMF
jgi:hypothetical protein